MKPIRLPILLLLLLLLTACSGNLTLAVTDAPIDDASAVTVQFTGVDLELADGSTNSFDFSPPKTLNLLALEGGTRAVLLDEDIDPDDYRAIHLRISADGSGTDSHLDRSDGRHALLLESANNGRLTMSRRFSVSAGESVALTFDFDLRKSVQRPSQVGEPYRLVPSLKLVTDDSVGAVKGVVSAEQVPGGCVPAVYAYSGSDVAPDDVGGTIEPFNTGRVRLNDTGEYRYRIGMLPAGAYTLALTCEAGDDEPDSNDAITFGPRRNVSILAEQDTSADF